MKEQVFCFRCNRPGELLYHHFEYPIVECLDCGQVFTGTRFKASLRGNFYDNKYFNKMYGKYIFHPSRIWHKIVAHRRLKLIKKYKKPSKILDIGCGHGTFLGIAQKKDWLVSGIESSKDAVEYINSFFNFVVYDGEIEDAPFQENSFDVITFWDVLEHIINPATFLERVRRLLKNGGLIALSVPNFESLISRIFKSKWFTLRPNEHIWHFGHQTIRKLLIEHGFTPLIIAKSPFNGPNLTRIDNMVIIAK